MTTGFTSILDGFICPITLELPLDPVTAEDGKLYERSAIEEWIQRVVVLQSAVLRSPVTNEEMGPNLYTSTLARNVIETALLNGALPKDEKRAEKWIKKIKDDKITKKLRENACQGDLEKIKDDKITKKLRENACQGDLEDMYKLGIRYYNLHKKHEAFAWLKKASDLGHAKSMALVGHCLSHGVGVKKNAPEGLLLLGFAAGLGSNYAAYVIGLAYSKGRFGLVKNAKMATLCLTKAIDDDNCRYKDLSEVSFKKAKSALNEIQSIT